MTTLPQSCHKDMLIEKLNSFYDMAAVWLVVALGMSIHIQHGHKYRVQWYTGISSQIRYVALNTMLVTF